MQWLEKVALRLLKWKYSRANHRGHEPLTQTPGADAEPNIAVEPTPNSFRSYVAPAASRA